MGLIGIIALEFIWSDGAGKVISCESSCIVVLG